ncbi:MAG: GNAT family N-acetyltransferase [Infirmifilum sp.]
MYEFFISNSINLAVDHAYIAALHTEGIVEIKKTQVTSSGLRISVEEDGRELGHCYIYLIRNDLHNQPYALLEDVYVNEEDRGKGVGTLLVTKAIETARELGCYKIIATSRFGRDEVHKWYEKLGFKLYGYEFRINLTDSH